MKLLFWSFSILLLMGSSSVWAKRSKSQCKIKADIKVERTGNRQYLWCLGDFEEDGDEYFITRRTFRVNDVTTEECDAIAEESIGERVKLQFIDSPRGMVMPMEPMTFQCDGTIQSIYKIKFKE